MKNTETYMIYESKVQEYLRSENKPNTGGGRLFKSNGRKPLVRKTKEFIDDSNTEGNFYILVILVIF